MSSYSPPKPSAPDRPPLDRKSDSTPRVNRPSGSRNSATSFLKAWPGTDGASDIIVNFLLEETGADGAALAFPEGGVLTYRARAGLAKSLVPKSLLPMNDWLRSLDGMVAVTELDFGSASMPLVTYLASAQLGAKSIILVPFPVSSAVGFVEVFSRNTSAFGEKEKLLVQLIATVVARAFPAEANKTAHPNTNERADFAKAAEQIAEKLNKLTRPTLVTRPKIQVSRPAQGRSQSDPAEEAQASPLDEKFPHATKKMAPVVRMPNSVPTTAAVVPAETYALQPNAAAPAINGAEVKEAGPAQRPGSESRLQPDIVDPVQAQSRKLERSTTTILDRLGARVSIEPATKFPFRTELVLAGLMLCVVLIFALRLHRGEVAPSGPQSRASHQEQPPTTLALVSSHMSLTDDPVARRIASAPDVPRALAAAQAGDAKAQYQLAMATETGNGAQQSCTTAAAWIGKSANQGYAPAEYNMALRYWDGDGVWSNRAEAVRWLRLAAQDGDLQAKKFLNKLPSEN